MKGQIDNVFFFLKEKHTPTFFLNHFSTLLRICHGVLCAFNISNAISLTHTHPCLKVPLGRKFIGLFPPNSVAEYRVLFIFPQKTEQQTFHPNIF